MANRSLSPTNRVDVERRAFTKLDPELRQILGPPPLYEGESEENYNQLYDRVRRTVLPEDTIEEIWVRDVVDLTWEILRLRRLKAKLMDAAASQGLENILDTLGTNFITRGKLIESWASGDTDAKKDVDHLLKKAGFDKATIEAQTLSARLDDFDRIDRLIMQSEGRRNAVLREIDRHRDTVARRMRDALADIADAEFEDVPALKGQARK